MKYTSEKKYGGQRASIGRSVVVKTEDNGLGAGLIDGIATDTDGETDTEEVWIAEAGEVGVMTGLVFHPTTTEAEIEAMPVGCWTWPVRV